MSHKKLFTILFFTSICVGWIFVCLSEAQAQKINRVEITNAEYAVKHSFTTENGLPANGVNQIHQDSDGYIWAATYNGLVRYNGNEFKLYNANNIPNLESNRFISVSEDREGRIWAGLEYRNIVMIDKDTSHVYRIGEDIYEPNISIYNIIQGIGNGYWVGTSAGLMFFSDGRFTHQSDLPVQTVQKMRYHNNQLYVLFDEYLYRVNEDGSVNELLLELRDNRVISYSGYVIEEFDQLERFRNVMIFDESLILTTESGIFQIFEEDYELLLRKEQLKLNIIDGLKKYKDSYFIYGANGVFRMETLHGEQIVAEKYSSRRTIHVLIDREESIWLATAAAGLQQVVGTPVYQGNRYEILSEMPLTAIMEDSGGDIWIGTNCDGLYRFSRDKYQVYRESEGILNTCVWSVAEQSDGTIWAGTWGRGVYYLPSGESKFRQFLPDIMKGAQAVLSIFEDSSGSVWFGTYYNGVFKFDGNETVAVLSTSGAPISAARMMVEDDDGNLLFATDQGIGFFDGEYIQLLEEFNLLDIQNFRVIRKDRDGRFWFGSYGAGIVISEPDGAIRTLTTDDGLYDDTVSQIEFDDAGNVWLAGNLGVFFIEKEELDRFFSDNNENRDLRIVKIGVREGIPTRETSGGFMPSSLLNANGELFIPTVQGLINLDVSRIRLDREVPSVLFEGVEIDGVQYTPEDLDEIAYDAQRMVFTFAALSFKNPDNVQLEYKMDGLDSNWQRVNDTREAIYTTLPAGEYTLLVRASNNHGFWNEQGVAVAFIVAPPFWQTTWFYILLAAVFGMLSLGVVNFRFKKIRKNNIELQKKVHERTRELEDSNNELKKLIDEKNKLHSILAHDLKNPFTSIIGYMDLLSQTFKRSGNTEYKEIMELLMDSGRSTLNLLENLLQWSGTTGEILEPDMESTNINWLVLESINMIDAQATFKGIHIEFKQGEAVYVNVDRNMILSVIRNVISNAIKFSGKDSKVYVSVQEQESNVLVCIKDYGVGMKEDELETFLDSNNIQHKHGTQGEKGVGMGLQLCSNFLKKHGEKIWVESKYGEGSTFYFTLPKVNESSTSDE